MILLYKVKIRNVNNGDKGLKLLGVYIYIYIEYHTSQIDVSNLSRIPSSVKLRLMIFDFQDSIGWNNYLVVESLMWWLKHEAPLQVLLPTLDHLRQSSKSTSEWSVDTAHDWRAVAARSLASHRSSVHHDRLVWSHHCPCWLCRLCPCPL